MLRALTLVVFLFWGAKNLHADNWPTINYHGDFTLLNTLILDDDILEIKEQQGPFYVVESTFFNLLLATARGMSHSYSFTPEETDEENVAFYSGVMSPIGDIRFRLVRMSKEELTARQEEIREKRRRLLRATD